MVLTPGLDMLLRHIPRLSFPPLVVWVASNFLVGMSLLATSLAYVLCIPFCLVVVAAWRSWALDRDKTRLGAQDVPLWKGKWPGSIDLLMELYNHWLVSSASNR